MRIRQSIEQVPAILTLNDICSVCDSYRLFAFGGQFHRAWLARTCIEICAKEAEEENSEEEAEYVNWDVVVFGGDKTFHD
jgi:hypothetical protein